MDDVSREIERKLKLMEEEISKDPERFKPKKNSIFGANGSVYHDRGGGWVEVSGGGYSRHGSASSGSVAIRSGETTTFGSIYYSP